MALKKDELANPDGCLNRAESTEPIFVLRAHDRYAPTAIRMWASLYRGNKKRTGAFDARAQQKYLEALKCAEQMEDWRL